MLWTIKRYKDLQAKQAPNVCSTSTAASTSSGIQQSEQCDDLPLTSEQQACLDKKARSRLIAERRAKILAQMQNAQKSFMKSNAEMFASTSNEESAASSVQKPAGSPMDWDDIADPRDEELGAIGSILTSSESIACLGKRRSQCEVGDNSFKCILCFEDCSISSLGPPLVSSAFLQTSRVINSKSSLAGLKSALHVSCCGHVMHYNCWKEYYSSEESKELRRPQRNRVSLTQAQNVEFHCPYCRTLSNTVLPVSEALTKFSPPHPPVSPHPMASTSTGAGAGAVESVLPLDCFVEIMRTLAAELKTFQTVSDKELPLYKNIRVPQLYYANPTSLAMSHSWNVAHILLRNQR